MSLALRSVQLYCDEQAISSGVATAIKTSGPGALLDVGSCFLLMATKYAEGLLLSSTAARMLMELWQAVLCALYLTRDGREVVRRHLFAIAGIPAALLGIKFSVNSITRPRRILSSCLPAVTASILAIFSSLVIFSASSSIARVSTKVVPLWQPIISWGL